MLDKPDIRGRQAILEVHAKDKPLASSISLVDLARQTAGFSGADLANLVNEAALLAARRNLDRVVEVSRLDQIKPGQMFFGFREWSVRDRHAAVPYPNGRRCLDWLQRLSGNQGAVRP